MTSLLTMSTAVYETDPDREVCAVSMTASRWHQTYLWVLQAEASSVLDDDLEEDVDTDGEQDQPHVSASQVCIPSRPLMSGGRPIEVSASQMDLLDDELARQKIEALDTMLDAEWPRCYQVHTPEFPPPRSCSLSSWTSSSEPEIDGSCYFADESCVSDESVTWSALSSLCYDVEAEYYNVVSSDTESEATVSASPVYYSSASSVSLTSSPTSCEESLSIARTLRQIFGATSDDDDQESGHTCVDELLTCEKDSACNDDAVVCESDACSAEMINNCIVISETETGVQTDDSVLVISDSQCTFTSVEDSAIVISSEEEVVSSPPSRIEVIGVIDVSTEPCCISWDPADEVVYLVEDMDGDVTMVDEQTAVALSPGCRGDAGASLTSSRSGKRKRSWDEPESCNSSGSCKRIRT